MVAEYYIPNVYISPHTLLGEGPTYVPSSHELYFVDIHRQTINGIALPDSATTKSYTSTNEESAPAIEVFEHWADGAKDLRTTQYDEPIGVLALTTDSPSTFVVGAKHGFAMAKIGDSKLKYIVDVYSTDAEKHALLRFNDGNVDSVGRFFAGTMMQKWETPAPPSVGSLFRLDPDGTVSNIFDGCQVPNGLCWPKDGKTMFYVDSFSKTVWKYDYDLSQGTVSDKVAIFVIDEPNMYPDGMTISAQGDLFIAVWGGGRVLQCDSNTGKLKAIYKLPAAKVTCPTFGGKDMDELFVTTASANEDLDYIWNEEDAKRDQGGEIFRFKVPGHSGLPRGVYNAVVLN
ncbi:hypothetical protein V1525DRAFT_138362 [Lipomyces kononenkoae]|uniref:Uncharacterized protein n=1 Tax=Lipomyces kononenkoae TaxID=34357 RepID=A0ACC3SQ07_LIPKO